MISFRENALNIRPFIFILKVIKRIITTSLEIYNGLYIVRFGINLLEIT